MQTLVAQAPGPEASAPVHEPDIPDLPTPFFHFDLAQLSDNLCALRAALPGFRFFYAMKCNPQRPILETLARCGSGFEIASAAELGRLNDLHIAGDEILFSNPVKAPSAIRVAREAGVGRFAFDSLEELEKIAEHAPGSAVYVRLATSGVGSRFPLSRRFGVSSEQALMLLQHVMDMGLVPYGCTFHVGSQNTEPVSWVEPIRRCGALMSDFERLTGRRLQMLDIGGGFPAQYATEPIPSINLFGESIRSALRALPYSVELVVEPGRALVADAAVLVTSIIGRRQRLDGAWLHLDTGPYNGLMEAGGLMGGDPYPISWSRDDTDQLRIAAILTGPTCDDADILQQALVPADLAVDDRLQIGVAGAYSSTLATTFNGFSCPSTYFKEDLSAVTESPTSTRVDRDGARTRVSRRRGATREALGLVAVLAAALLWAVAANLAEGLYASGLTGLQVAGTETVIAAAFLLVVKLCRRSAPKQASVGGLQRLALGVSLTLMVTTYYVALESLAVGPAVVLHYSAPALIMIWTVFRTRRSPGLRMLICLGFAIAGIVLVAEVIEGVGELNPLGVTAALSTAAFFAAYTLLSESATAKVGPLEATTNAFLVAAPLSLGVIFAGGDPEALLSVDIAGRMLFIGFFGALLGTGLYIWGIDKLRSTKASIAANLEPVLATVIAWIWLGQSLSPLQTLGGVLIVVAVVLLHDRQGSHAQPLGRPNTRGPTVTDQLALAVDVQFGRWDSSPHTSS